MKRRLVALALGVAAVLGGLTGVAVAAAPADDAPPAVVAWGSSWT